LNLDLTQLEELKSDVEKLLTEIQLSIDDIKYINQHQESKLKSLHKTLSDNTLEEVNTQISIKKFTIKTHNFYTQVPNVDSKKLATD
jgi:predicted Zn-dependent protease